MYTVDCGNFLFFMLLLLFQKRIT